MSAPCPSRLRQAQRYAPLAFPLFAALRSAGIKIGLYGDIVSVADNTEHTWKLLCYDKANGKTLVDKTVLTGIQCDGWSGTWAYTANEGSASSPKPHWVKASGTACNPQKWSTYKWHHIQFSLSRDNSGYVTYHSVWLDGVQTNLNAKVFGGANLGWGKINNTQFQVDGYGSSGHVTAYFDHLKISSW